MTDVQAPNFAILLGPFIGEVPEEGRPRFLALLERGAAERYRAWAEALLAGVGRDRRVADGVAVPDPWDETRTLVVPVRPSTPLPKAAEEYFARHRRAVRGLAEAERHSGIVLRPSGADGAQVDLAESCRLGTEEASILLGLYDRLGELQPRRLAVRVPPLERYVLRPCAGRVGLWVAPRPITKSQPESRRRTCQLYVHGVDIELFDGGSP